MRHLSRSTLKDKALRSRRLPRSGKDASVLSIDGAKVFPEGPDSGRISAVEAKRGQRNGPGSSLTSDGPGKRPPQPLTLTPQLQTPRKWRLSERTRRSGTPSSRRPFRLASRRSWRSRISAFPRSRSSRRHSETRSILMLPFLGLERLILSLSLSTPSTLRPGSSRCWRSSRQTSERSSCRLSAAVPRAEVRSR